MDKQNEATSSELAEEYCKSHNIEEENVKEAIRSRFSSEHARSYAIAVEIDFDPYIFADVLYALSCWLGLKEKQALYKERMDFDWKTALDDTTFKKEGEDKDDDDEEDEDEATENNPEVAPVAG